MKGLAVGERIQLAPTLRQRHYLFLAVIYILQSINTVYENKEALADLINIVAKKKFVSKFAEVRAR